MAARGRRRTGSRARGDGRRATATLDYYVIVAAAGETQNTPEFVHRATTYRTALVPARGYCFSVQGSDGTHVYESEPRGIRGAVCRR